MQSYAGLGYLQESVLQPSESREPVRASGEEEGKENAEGQQLGQLVPTERGTSFRCTYCRVGAATVNTDRRRFQASCSFIDP